jgi:hypothetical protein
MNTCQWLTLVGATLELLGLGTVMLGISETRRAFTDRPSLLAKLLNPLKRLIARFRRKPQVVEIGLAGEISLADSMTAKLTTNWEGVSLHERLQDYASRHEDLIEVLGERIDREEVAREAGDRSEAEQREILRATLDKKISDAAAGGLTLETSGIALFAVGLVLQALGSIITCG